MAPSFEFISGSKESVKPVEKADKKAPDKLAGDTLQEIGRQAKDSFTSRESRNAYLKTLEDEMKANLDQFSPAMKKQLLNSDGSINHNELAKIYGLDSQFRQHLTPEGKLKPLNEVAEEKMGRNKLPDRPADAKNGSDLFQEWGLNRNMNKFQDELTERIIREIEKGNVPDSCRNMSTISMQGPEGIKISFKTSNGYLAVGSNNDHIRVPLSGPMSKKIADHFGWVLPTADMASITDRQANIKLSVGGLVNNNYDKAHMADLEYARRHNLLAQKKLQQYLEQYNQQARAQNQPELTAEEFSRQLIRGEKKNIFIGQGATRPNGGIGIGGLLDGKGRPIQPYGYPHAGEVSPRGESGAHGDYSQSTAIYDSMISVYDPKDGKSKEMPFYQAMKDPRYARILNASEAQKYNNDGTFDADLAYTAHS